MPYIILGESVSLKEKRERGLWDISACAVPADRSISIFRKILEYAILCYNSL
jgi:hypothetical protein